MDWKQETILTLMGIPVIATMVYGISEFVEKKIRDITPYEESWEYKRTHYKELEEES